jgi:hypothetical protein
MRFFDFSAAGASKKKAIKKQRHDKKSRVTTQNLLGIFLFYEKFCLVCEQSRCICSV